MDATYERLMSDVVKVFEVVGVAVLVVGSVLAFTLYARQLLGGASRITAFTSLRAQLGRSILLGLEILVIADIVRTIVVEPTLDSALTLGVIVLVRVLLSLPSTSRWTASHRGGRRLSSSRWGERPRAVRSVSSLD